jgi:myo-inositol 2-dehydrogenase/D-chiro-inositol 1-dehydrogenase
VRIGLIGLGRIGAFHAETLSTLPPVTSLVVTDVAPAAIQSVVDKYGVETADTPEKLLASGVDGVIVAAATDAHPELIVAAVEARVPVFCEKPVAKTIAEGVQVARRVAGSGVPIQIGYPRRFDVAFAAIRQAVANGELGWVHTVRSTTLDPAPPPPAYLAVSGGIFRDCSIHDFDAVRWVTGREVVEVYATGSDRGDPVFADLGDVAFAATVLTLDDGARAVVSNSRYNARGHDVRLEVHGSDDAGGRSRRRAPAALGPAGRDLPRRHAVHVLHGPLRGCLPGVAGSVHRGGRRYPTLAVHRRRRTGDRLGRRGRDAVAGRAPARPHRRGEGTAELTARAGRTRRGWGREVDVVATLPPRDHRP